MTRARAGQAPIVMQRQRASALARHYRDVERLSIAEIAQRLGRSPASVRAYLHDPDGTKIKRLKETYRGRCSRCGRLTSGTGPRNARALCAGCSGRSSARWSRPQIEQALRAWYALHGGAATSTDLSMSYAKRRSRQGDPTRLERLQAGWEGGRPWPPASVVQYHYGTVRAANTLALAHVVVEHGQPGCPGADCWRSHSSHRD